MEIWKNIITRLKDNKKAILLLVASHNGSSPGKQGFKMIVSEDNYLFGSIGGGRTEFTLVEKAKEYLKDNNKIEPFLVSQIHRNNDKDSSGMICAGEQNVVFYPLNEHNIVAIQSIIDSEKSVLTITPNKFEVDNNHELKDDFLFTKESKSNWEFKENSNRNYLLYIIGAGHVGLATAKLFETLDFDITLLDNRESHVLDAQPDGFNKKLIDYNNVAQSIPEGNKSYVIIMTHGHKVDMLVFKKLIKRNYKYLGLLGSKSKVATLFKALKSEGTSQGDLDKIDAPIGLKINSKTPAEIAVSIAAKIISVKNGIKPKT